MNNDTALILLLADRQREIEALRAQVVDLEQEATQLERANAEQAAAPRNPAIEGELEALRAEVSELRSRVRATRHHGG